MDYRTNTPILTDITIGEETNSYDVHIDNESIFHAVSLLDGKVKKYKYTIPFDEIQSKHKTSILSYQGIPSDNELYAGDVFLHGDFIQEII